MKRYTTAALLTAAICVLLTAGCEDMNAKNTNRGGTYKSPQPVHFTLGIEQDGKKLPVDKLTHSVRLRKKPFKIVFYFEKMSSMLVQASFEPTLVRKAQAGESMDQIIRQDGTIVEDLLNPNFTLYVSREGLYHNWLYFGPKTHRFDADKGVQEIPEKEGGGYYCVRTVQQLDEDGQSLTIEDCPENKIYLLFFKVDRVPGSQRLAERQRDWLVLDFAE
ncbi:MAG: hypothetical protein JXA11_01860 [Phycisphaerae bacterium]|nr:hypothetical protein [Phycisphaerae bacterium]